jgi:micrococcal nuclease
MNHFNSANHFFKAFLLFSILVVVGCTSNHNRKTESGSEYYSIKKHIDGDTFWVYNSNGEDFKVRLIGINSPESRSRFKKKKEPYGKAATAHIIELIGSSQVRLEFDVDSLDQYKRTLGYVFLPDGTFINEKMIEDGFAQVATYPPNVKYVNRFIEAERQARGNNNGLWAEGDVE